MALEPSVFIKRWVDSSVIEEPATFEGLRVSYVPSKNRNCDWSPHGMTVTTCSASAGLDGVDRTESFIFLGMEAQSVRSQGHSPVREKRGKTMESLTAPLAQRSGPPSVGDWNMEPCLASTKTVTWGASWETWQADQQGNCERYIAIAPCCLERHVIFRDFIHPVGDREGEVWRGAWSMSVLVVSPIAEQTHSKSRIQSSLLYEAYQGHTAAACLPSF
jgi:hypothetical protein